MSNYLPLVKKQYEFEGDHIEVEFSLLTRQQMMSLLPVMPESKEDKQTSEQQSKLMDVSLSALKENVKSFSGLKDANGNAISFDDAIDSAYFTSLMSDIISDMFEASTLSEGDEKKSRKRCTGT